MFDVSEVKLRLIGEGTNGLIGWASCIVNGALYLNNIAIRRGRDGDIHLTYPGMISRSEHRYFYFNPITQEAKRLLDNAILGSLNLVGDQETTPQGEVVSEGRDVVGG